MDRGLDLDQRAQVHDSLEQLLASASCTTFVPMLAEAYPKPWTDETLGAADVVVTMGCGDACPVLPGVRYPDWGLADPAGRPLDEVRALRADVRARVEALLVELGVAPVDA